MLDLELLYDDLVKNNSLHKLVRDSGRMLRCPLLVADISFHVIDSYLPEGFHDEVLEAAIKRQEITYEVVSSLDWEHMADDTGAIYRAIESSPYVRRFSRLVCDGIHLGYLICLDINSDLSLIGPNQMRRLEAILSKQLFCQERRDRIYGSDIEELLSKLLDGKFSGEAAFNAQVGTAFLLRHRKNRLVIIDIGLYHSLNFKDELLKKELCDAFPDTDPFLYKNNVLMLLESSQNVDVFSELSDRYQLRIVISDVFTELYSMKRVYKSCHELMTYLLSCTTGGFSVYFGQFRELFLLRRIKVRPDMIDPRVQRLSEYDREKDTQLCLTLYTYLICHHSLQDTCKRLFTHKNTILYRLNRIRDDMGIDLDSPDEVLPLLLSCAIVLLGEHRDQLFIKDFSLKNSGAFAPPPES